MTGKGDTRRDIAQQVVAKGTELAGGAVAAAIGFLAGGPETAALLGAGGVAVTQVFQRLGNEVNQRYLSEREAVRVGAAMAFAIEKVRANLEGGLQVRSDDFFRDRPGERAAAEEILEGVLLAAQREHEERKLRYLGNLVANLAFRPDIDRAQANLLVRVAEAISYRQLCLLVLIGRKDRYGLRETGIEIGQRIEQERVSVLQELMDLYDRSLVFLPYPHEALRLYHLLPGKMELQGLGLLLAALMEPWDIDDEELEGLAALLRP